MRHLVVTGLLLAAAPSLHALPTMIRLGYNNCSACHIAPQGAGLLNPYGRSIDQAQSLVGGEYNPWENSFSDFINWGGRITQDVRTVMQQQDNSTDAKPGTQTFRSRFIYRNATELGNGFRITVTLTGENTSAPRSSLAYDPATTPSQLFFNTTLLSYRRKTLEISVGRDQLPTGVNISDLSTFVRARNNLGYYDAATQAKVFWWGQRYLVTPYVYGPGGDEKSGWHESGGGALVEFRPAGQSPHNGRRQPASRHLRHGRSLHGRTLRTPRLRQVGHPRRTRHHRPHT